MTETRRLRVLQVTGTLYIGGAEKVIVSLANELDRSRFETEVCCTYDLGPLTKTISDAGSRVTLAADGKRSHAYLRTLGLRREIVRFRPDIIHTHGLQAMVTAGPLAMCGLLPRWVHTFHFGNYPYANRRYMFFERFFGRWADQLVAVAEPQRQSIVKHHGCSPARIVTFHNGVPDKGLFDDESVRRQKRGELAVPADAFVVGTIAVLTEQKGIDYLIDAARELLSVVPSARLIIVGNGSRSESLRARVTSLGLDGSIMFTGWRSDVTELLQLMDVYVMSSLWEAMPLALLEAMAAARPIVVTDVGDNRNIVQQGTAAVVVPPRDASALARAIIELAQHPDRARELGCRAREAFVANFTVSRMVNRYEALYAGDSAVPRDAAEHSTALSA